MTGTIAERGHWILYLYSVGQEQGRWYFHGRYGKEAALKFADAELRLSVSERSDLGRVGRTHEAMNMYYVLTSMERKDKIDPLYKDQIR
jgi:hypothetical protein